MQRLLVRFLVNSDFMTLIDHLNGVSTALKHTACLQVRVVPLFGKANAAELCSCLRERFIRMMDLPITHQLEGVGSCVCQFTKLIDGAHSMVGVIACGIDDVVGVRVFRFHVAVLRLS
ncbi:hypothetical protein DBR34_03565 [Stenotrophomonas sp. HMWF003]|nr:hypothetical protein DBR34_03565 [Stenotrophomonas sp. HMWF003]